MSWSQGSSQTYKLIIKSLGSSGIRAAQSIATVRMLDSDAHAQFTRTADALEITVPGSAPTPVR